MAFTHADAELTFVPGELVPDGQTVLGAYEAAAIESGREARDHGLTAIRGNYPKRTGRSAREIRGTVSRTADGVAVTIAPPRRRAYIYRFVEGGTGARGGFGRIPKGRRGRLPGGAVPAGLGQAAQHPFERTREQEGPRVVEILETGPQTAARKLGL